MKKKCLVIRSLLSLFLLAVAGELVSNNNQLLASDADVGSHSSSIISFSAVDGYFPLAVSGKPVPLYTHSDDYQGVIRALKDLQSDFELVTKNKPKLSINSVPKSKRVVIAGTLGNNQVIDKLAEDGKINAEELDGKWEKFIIQVVDNPVKGVDQALVIAGSDKRGTIFGIYEISRQIGVSPWYWWADVPVSHQPNLYVSPERFTLGEPKVQYRGIFLNNDEPALGNWVRHSFGGFNHQFYEKVFELILRLRGNYLWPAMWGKAFHDDCPHNAPLADMYGVVIGYTHHEPMMRAHIEWARYGEGDWDYQTNEEGLREFWIEGIERMKDYESTVTLAMRGDGDEPLSEEANIELIERVVNDQREIIQNYAKNPDDVIQVWALYKEVMDYYNRGMEVPDDVLILLTNDNWGNIRYLPDPDDAAKRSGGWGMYYHFDYVGGPRSYKWINTIQISRIWEQMNVTYRHNIDKMWLVNVGDLKPMEFPISFFLDFAWNPDAIPADVMGQYPKWWAQQQFGKEFAEEIAHLLNEYTRINSRRKPELLNEDTYSIIHFREGQRVVEDYNNLLKEAERINEKISEEYRDAFFQLVLYPVKASANLNEMYVSVAKNRLYARQLRSNTTEMADKVRYHFDMDAKLNDKYHSIADGKWMHMMSQTRIGYTYWNQPPWDVMPNVTVATPHDPADMGVAIEGSGYAWPQAGRNRQDAVLPKFDKFNQQSFYIDVFNRGRFSFEYSADTDVPWLLIDNPTGTVEKQERLLVSVDWTQVPEGTHRQPIRISGPDNRNIIVYAEVFNPSYPVREEVQGFVEANGYVSIEAPNFTRKIDSEDAWWKYVPDLGRTYASMVSFPVLADVQTPGDQDAPRLEYDMHLFSEGEVTVHVYLAPTKNFKHERTGLKYGISFNDEDPQIENIHTEILNWGDYSYGAPEYGVWASWVSNNINVLRTTHTIDKPGKHTLKIWMKNPNVVIQKIVVQTGEMGETYLGPPQSFFNK
ncbi:glycosyl hydrolase 115 family protein [Alkalitalea saponilacus]|uniref:Glycosyl hydrolase family 115 n=1 Tax=Alkalitalea saponilacus TaxID=889453 RepID=A0A1T5AKI5_9BACT|nr:glycosyl hydrolase 115 family protein [Alkalitalea saponilacus]ASB48672.1 glycosyl hydrolase [Alkalitalea saponilacus]SKB35405.1 Glycosyl hydrolase family 115 [Alkalitalea saponilacus]